MPLVCFELILNTINAQVSAKRALNEQTRQWFALSCSRDCFSPIRPSVKKKKVQLGSSDGAIISLLILAHKI